MTVNDKMALEPGPFLALNLFIFAKYPGREENSSGKWISL